jgi:hypothetical protein
MNVIHNHSPEVQRVTVDSDTLLVVLVERLAGLVGSCQWVRWSDSETFKLARLWGPCVIRMTPWRTRCVWMWVGGE